MAATTGLRIIDFQFLKSNNSTSSASNGLFQHWEADPSCILCLRRNMPTIQLAETNFRDFDICFARHHESFLDPTWTDLHGKHASVRCTLH